jgi:hypothetical protein
VNYRENSVIVLSVLEKFNVEIRCVLYMYENVIQQRFHVVITFHSRLGHEGQQGE